MTKYKIRKLKTVDVFRASKILKKLEVKMSVKDGMSSTELGAMLIQQILENAHMAETEINAFMGDLIGITPEEFSELPIEETLSIFASFKEMEGISGFLQSVQKLTM